MSQLNKKVEDKTGKDTKKHSTRNMIILLFIFTASCIGITVFLIMKSNNGNNITPITNKGEEFAIQNNQGIERVADSGDFGIKSLDETYTANDLKIIKKEHLQGKKLKYDNHQISINYIEISGLKNKEVQDKINNKIKEYTLDLKDTIKGDERFSTGVVCMANFSDVLSLQIWNSKDKINDEYGNGEYKTYGLNFDLSTGNEIKFENLFTSDASIKNILLGSLNESYFYQLGYYNQEEDEGEVEIKSEGYEEIERKSFEFMSRYKNGEEIQYYFSTSKVYIIDEIYTIAIDMIDYYNQIAIYKRYKSNTNLYDGSYTDYIKNDNILVLLPTNNTGVFVENNYSDAAIVMRPEYMNVLKISNNLIISIKDASYDEDGSILKNVARKLNNVIDEYKNIKDEKCRYIEMSYNELYGYSNSNKEGYTITVNEYVIISKNKNKFMKKIQNELQHGTLGINNTDYTLTSEDENKSWKSVIDKADEIEHNVYELNYYKDTKTWTRDDDPYNENYIEESDVPEEENEQGNNVIKELEETY